MSYAGDDLTPLLVPTEAANVGFRQGVVLAWNQQTGENQILVGGSPLTNLPMLNISDALLLAPGDVVSILTFGHGAKSMAVLGRFAVPGTPQALSALSALATVSATVAVGEVTSSQTFTDLATVGPRASITVRPSGRVMLIMSSRIGWPSANNGGGTMAGRVSGANTAGGAPTPAEPPGATPAAPGSAGGQPLLSGTLNLAGVNQTGGWRSSIVHVYQGLNPGLTTWTAKYRSLVVGNTADFDDRTIVLFPL
ncbi:hypothetical protein K1W54_28790 [Micromonospora sp. CPCC 205371]|nr:hypothetical protein [Micromonospora sp. CPCC 205371]